MKTKIDLNAKSTLTEKLSRTKFNAKRTPNGHLRCEIPPRASRTQRLLVNNCDPGNLVDDGHVMELLVDLPQIQLLRGPDVYLVDSEVCTEIKIDGSREYSVKHAREFLGREMALHRLISTVVPSEFRDLLQPMLKALEAAV